MNVASRSVVEAKDSFMTSRLLPVAAASGVNADEFVR